MEVDQADYGQDGAIYPHPISSFPPYHFKHSLQILVQVWLLLIQRIYRPNSHTRCYYYY